METIDVCCLASHELVDPNDVHVIEAGDGEMLPNY